MQGEANDRYEPLPGFFELPGFLWRKLPRTGKVAVATLAAALVVLAIVLSPVIQHTKEQRARADAALQVRLDRQEVAQIRREQKPRFGHGAPAGADVPARERLVASVAASIKADANARAAAGEFHGPILHVKCDPYPPSSAGADQAPSRPTGSYKCLAVTSVIPATAGNKAGAVGQLYRTKLHFGNGRYAFCKIRGRPGELAVRLNAVVPVPAVCGG